MKQAGGYTKGSLKGTHTLEQWAARLDMTKAEVRQFLVTSIFSGGGAYTTPANLNKYWTWAHYGHNRRSIAYLLRTIKAATLRPKVRARLLATVRAMAVHAHIDRLRPDQGYTPCLWNWRTHQRPEGVAW